MDLDDRADVRVAPRHVDAEEGDLAEGELEGLVDMAFGLLVDEGPQLRQGLTHREVARPLEAADDDIGREAVVALDAAAGQPGS